MNVYTVGELYNPSRTSWPEQVEYNYRQGVHELLMFLNRPTGKEIHAVTRGPASFALYVQQPVIVFCYRFLPAIPWGDAPFSLHLVPDAQRTVPELPDPFLERALLSITLVDATTGIVRGLRAVTLSPEFTAELHLAIRAQSEAEWDANSFDRTLRGLYASFETAALVNAATVKCRGGA